MTSNSYAPPAARPWLVVCILISWLGAGGGCRTTSIGEVRAQQAATYLANRFHVVAAGAARAETDTGGSLIQHMDVTRRGKRLDAMILVAPIIIRASLSGVVAPVLLEALATPVYNLGDGVQMDVYLIQDGERNLVFSRIFDAGRRAADRDWTPLSIPLEIKAAGKRELEIRASAGPRGDLVADWLALGGMRFSQRQPTP